MPKQAKKQPATPAAKEKVAKMAVIKKPPVEKPIKAEPVSAVTKPEYAKLKKATTRVNKAEELTRRLTKAKSSLLNGLDAAIKSAAPAAQTEVGVKSQPSYMTPVQKPVAAKKPEKVAFDQIAQVPEVKPVQKPVKPVNGKVSFDSLVTAQQENPQADFDISAFYKK